MTAQFGSTRPASGSGAMNLAQALSLEPLSEASVVAGASGVGRDVRWADVVDIPDPLPWVGQGQLLLTTGISWPREDEQQRQLIRELARRNLAGVLLAVPRLAARGVCGDRLDSGGPGRAQRAAPARGRARGYGGRSAHREPAPGGDGVAAPGGELSRCPAGGKGRVRCLQPGAGPLARL